jgi:hypothetical protein
MDAAQSACAAMPECSGVFDANCDGQDSFTLCNTEPGSFSHSDGGSCVHSKVWNKATLEHCDHSKFDGTFSTLDAAKAECTVRTTCNGGNDNSCDGSTFYLCTAGAGWLADSTSEADSCVYRKVWTQHELKHCSGQTHDGEIYGTLDEAQNACATNAACSGVYDPSCDGAGTFYLCKPGNFEDSFSSCVPRARAAAARRPPRQQAARAGGADPRAPRMREAGAAEQCARHVARDVRGAGSRGARARSISGG